jgi:alpha-tubulin suppressor-like RCC1 family protein
MLEPQAVAGGLTFTSLSAGAAYACGITTTGTTVCWGNNAAGQLGTTSGDTCPFDPELPCALTPVAVEGGLTFTALAVGDAHTRGMVADGHVYCWGGNDDAELGDGTSAAHTAPALSMFTP